MSHSDMEPFMLATGVILVGAGAYGIVRAAETARRNQARIDSGEESYFEERRVWEHYGRPPTDPKLIRRAGWFTLLGGIVLLLTYSPISIFHWS